MVYKNQLLKFYITTFFLVMAVLASFYTLHRHIEQSHRGWIDYAEREMEKTDRLNQAVNFFGYGGFIHNFKNAVIRKDRQYLQHSSQQIDAGIRSLNKYMASSPEYQEEISEVVSVFFSYREKLPYLYALIDENASIQEIDEAVRVDDKKAIEALNVILDGYSDSPVAIIEESKLEHDKIQKNLFVVLGFLSVVGSLFVAFFVYSSRSMAIKIKDLELVFSCAPSAILTVDGNGFITSANKEAMNLFGFSGHNIHSINVDELVPMPLKSKHKKLREDFQKSDKIRAMQQRDMLFQGRKLNGEVFPASISVASHSVGGEKHNVVVVHDLSEEHQYKNQANTDFLTNLANRRSINAELSLALDRFKRQKSPLAICIFDIDYFKRVNDEFGHLTGDEVIRKVADILESCRRKTDFLGRWGGEEFVVILENTDKVGAINFAEKIRENVKQQSRQSDFPMPITISVGGVLCGEDDTVVSVFNRADQALYQSKEGGRDCVTIL